MVRERLQLTFLFSDQSKGWHLFSFYHGGVRGPPDQQVSGPESDVLYEDPGQEILFNGALT